MLRLPLSRCLVLLVLTVVALGSVQSAQGETAYVSGVAATGSFPLVQAGAATPLIIDANDWPGVRHAATALQSDLAQVTNVRPQLRDTSPTGTKHVVFVGTIGRSALIDRLIASGKLNVAAIQGRWEAYLSVVIDAPIPGVERALVIAGSDKRGTIYGIYDLSQQIGVSPWHWWADVPVVPQAELFVNPSLRVEEGPVVKYRGIFLNDEAPSLTNWTREKFGGFNHQFYEKVFELMLRLRANYLWPAMWGSAFNDDDPLNAALADEYGIVMGTSHHEPLMRAHDEWRRYGRGSWDYAKNPDVLREFWRSSVERTKAFENIQSLGMRGDGDEPMSEQANVALLESIVADQREILASMTGRPASEVPQLWALYKEVQGYYERGMRVPDDVTLLWCDDNWGNIRRLPTVSERKRSGGAGIYYHFDYVGGPRNYKWLNTVPLTKIWEQMHLAWQYDANRIWIVNVGDLKPMEFPIEFFLSYAWNPARWPYEQLEAYSVNWAARQFGNEHAKEVASLINAYTKLNSRRKPEMLAPETLSFVNYHEADRVLAEWRSLVTRAEALEAAIPEPYRDALFQLVTYPVKASANAQELHATTGLNRLYVRQGRAAANEQAMRARAFFQEDANLVARYHSLGAGKWNHMMDQVKFGYTYWQQPDIETMPAVSEVRARSGSAMGIAIEGSETAWPSYGAKPAVLPRLTPHGPPDRWIEVFNRGDTPFTFKASADQPWVKITPADGTIDLMKRLVVTVDWKHVPIGDSDVTITVAGTANEKTSIRLPLSRPTFNAQPGDFLESDDYLALEALHFSRSLTDSGVEWKTLPEFGRTAGGVTPFPVTFTEQREAKASARLEYDLHVTSSGKATLELHCAPSLDFQPDQSLTVGVSIDDLPVTLLKLDTAQTLQTWEKAVGEGIRRINTDLSFAQPGRHTLKLWAVAPGVVVERIIIDFGGVRASYLGPPASVRASLTD